MRAIIRRQKFKGRHRESNGNETENVSVSPMRNDGMENKKKYIKRDGL